jgi:hypothetical protein
MRGRDRLELEGHVVEPRARERRAQPRQRQPLVEMGRVAGEPHGPADDARAERAERPPPAHLGDQPRDEILG